MVICESEVMEIAVKPARKLEALGMPEGRDNQDAQQTHATLSVSIGVITRSRPNSLIRLLESFTRLSIDEDLTVVFIVVENGARKTLKEALAKFQSAVPWASVIYENEPRIGIPCARNRVLEISLNSGCDLHAFVDDDETVDSAWLGKLVRELRGRSLDLVGGPVRLLSCPEDATSLERIVWKGLVHRQARVERAAKRRWDRGRDGLVKVVTNNWLVDLSLIRSTGLKFDESLGFSGGSDTLFFRQAKLNGARSGWAPEAFVSEFMPKARLCLVYQFRRGRDHATANYRKKYAQLTPKIFILSCGFIVYKCLSAGALLGLALLDGGRSLVRGVRAFGFAIGRAAVMFGSRSRHYEHVQGE